MPTQPLIRLILGLCVLGRVAPLGAQEPDAPPEGVPQGLLDIATGLAGSVTANGLAEFPGVAYPLFVVQEGSAAAHVIASSEGFPPEAESLRMRAEDVRARLMPGAALLTFTVADGTSGVPCFVIATLTGPPREPGAPLTYEVHAIAVGLPGDLLRQETAAIRAVTDRFAEAYISGRIHAFTGVGTPLIVIDGDAATYREDYALPSAPLAGHTGPIEDYEVLLAGDVGVISLTLLRDEGPIAAVLLICLVEGQWRVPLVCVGRSMGPLTEGAGLGADEMLVDGVPPLLGSDVNNCIALFGFALNLHLSHGDRETVRQALAHDFAGSDEDQRQGLLALCRAWTQIEEMPPDTRWRVRRELLDDLLAGAREQPQLAVTRLFLDLHERTLEVLVPGPDALTRDVAESYARLLGAISSLVAQGTLEVPSEHVEDLIAELVRVYPNMEPLDQHVVRSSVYTWARLQMIWQAADTHARDEVISHLRAWLQPAYQRARRGGAFVPPEVMGRADSDEARAFFEHLFPPDTPDAGPTMVDLQGEIDAAERQGRGEIATMLSQVRHELARDLTLELGPRE